MCEKSGRCSLAVKGWSGLAELLGRGTHHLLESREERLPVLETDHRADVIDGVGGKPLVAQMPHGIVYAVEVYQFRITHAIFCLEDSRQLERRQTEHLSQLCGRECRVAVSFSLYEDAVNPLFVVVMPLHFGGKVTAFHPKKEGMPEKMWLQRAIHRRCNGVQYTNAAPCKLQMVRRAN